MVPRLTAVAPEAAPGMSFVRFPLRRGPSECHSGDRGDVRRRFHPSLLPERYADLSDPRTAVETSSTSTLCLSRKGVKLMKADGWGSFSSLFIATGNQLSTFNGHLQFPHQ